MAQRDPLTIESLTRKQVTYLRLVGVVGDEFNETAVLEAAKGKDLIIDLNAVEQLSSDGARKWGRVIESLAERPGRLVFVDCPRALVTELNVSAKLAQRVSVASVRVRHVCRKCNSVFKVLYDLSRNQEFGKRGISTKCQRCGGAMTVDENLATYLGFRSESKQPALDAGFLGLIKSFPSELGKAVDATLSKEKKAAAALAAKAGKKGAAAPEKAKSGWARLSGAQRAGLGGGAAILLIAGSIAAVMAVNSSSVDVELAAMQQHIQQGRLDVAESLLSDLEESQRVAASVVAKYRAEINAIRKDEQLEKRTGVLQAFQEGRYGEIIDQMQGVDPADIADTQIAFAVGESYRHANRLAEAAEYYRVVITAPKPGRMLDDAIFWRAESLLLNAKIPEATALFERIVKKRRGNFIKSAKRRLASIRKGELK